MTLARETLKKAVMKNFALTTLALCVPAALASVTFAGPEPIQSSGKEMKQVATVPVECNWTGFYIGIHGGGNWGHSETEDHDGYYSHDVGDAFGYDASGAVVGGTLGYNHQWHCLVLGVEADLGYMNVDGDGTNRYDAFNFASDTRVSTESDFYTTIRGRLGFAWHKWLFYGTGGGIGLNFTGEVHDTSDAVGEELLDAEDQEFDWGWCAGGGIEYMIGCHWTIKAEYLRYEIDGHDFSGHGRNFGGNFDFGADNAGNIVRAGLNYKF